MDLKKINTKRKYLFFYSTLIYLLSFLLWWTFLLYQKTEFHYSDSLKYKILKYTTENNPIGSYLNSEEYDSKLKRHKREKIMIVTESFVFSIVLIFLVFKVKKSVEHEIEMSKQQQNFILSITHELKSPLSSIKLMSQTLARHDLNETQKNMLINNSLSEVDRLQNLVENVLLAAKIDNNSYGFLKKEINLSDLVIQLIRRCKTSNCANIETSIKDNIIFNADIAGVTSIIINLVENALKYSEENSLIKVSLAKKDKTIIFRVEDQGIGISDVEKNKIFDKFYRVGDEEIRATKGTGLGLYIVKNLVEFHDGTIQVSSNKIKGSTFEVVFNTKT